MSGTVNKVSSITLAVAVTVIMASWLAGYPIYGSPAVKDNRPLLKKPLLIDHLEAPNFVVTATGERFEVKGIVFEPFAIQSPAKNLHQYFNDPDPLRISPDPLQPSGVAFEWKNHYFCGNTFFSRFFPKPLPKYRVADFGRGMVVKMFAKESH